MLLFVNDVIYNRLQFLQFTIRFGIRQGINLFQLGDFGLIFPGTMLIAVTRIRR